MSAPTRVAAIAHVANVANIPTIAEAVPCTGCGFPLDGGACTTSWCDLARGAAR